MQKFLEIQIIDTTIHFGDSYMVIKLTCYFKDNTIVYAVISSPSCFRFCL